MPRLVSESLESIIQASISRAMAGVAPRVAKLVAAAAAAQVEAEVARTTRGAMSRPGKRPRPARAEITKWTADARARRVPNFVIEATGLDTKKQIVAKYGPVTFEKGKPVPPVLGEKKSSRNSPPRKAQGKKSPEKQPVAAGDGKKASPSETVRAVVARPPVIRKRAATA